MDISLKCVWCGERAATVDLVWAWACPDCAEAQPWRERPLAQAAATAWADLHRRRLLAIIERAVADIDADEVGRACFDLKDVLEVNEIPAEDA